jgi:hypothetical protein
MVPESPAAVTTWPLIFSMPLTTADGTSMSSAFVPVGLITTGCSLAALLWGAWAPAEPSA